MNKIKIYIVLFFTMLFVTGCFMGNSISDTMASWKGHHKSELIQKWGPASSIQSDGKGGEVYSYYFDRNKSATTSVNYAGNLVTRDNSYSAQRHFYINKDGIIYSWKWQGY